jgi:AraC-like DNA-binding protein
MSDVSPFQLAFAADGRVEHLPRPSAVRVHLLQPGGEVRLTAQAGGLLVVALDAPVAVAGLQMEPGQGTLVPAADTPLFAHATQPCHLLVFAFVCGADLLAELGDLLPGCIRIPMWSPALAQLLDCQQASTGELALSRTDAARVVLGVLGAVLDENLGDPQRPDLSRPVREAMRLITSDPQAVPGVAELAERVGVSPEHLARLFRKELGTSPLQAITERRIQLACRLLRSTVLSLAEIAVRCGYADAGALGEAFRARVGMPPGQYRAQRSAPPVSSAHA